MREIYFDNSATTKVFPEVADIVMKTMTEDYGNPSSKHQKGFDAEKYFRTAREQVAETLKVKPREIVFTSGGTESNNTAIFGTSACAAPAWKAYHHIAGGACRDVPAS